MAAGTVLACRWALQVDNWRVMTDEMLYLKQAQSVADTLSPRPEFRDVALSNYGVLYPVLLAPLFGLLDLASAFRVGHGLGALLMASTALPAYLLARYVTGSRLVGLVAAGPVAAAPWLLMSINLLTEVLAAPLFMWVAYAFVRATAEPSWRSDLVALGLSVLLIFTRTQFIFMPVLLVLAVVVHEVARRLADRPPRAWLGGAREGIVAAVRNHPVLAGASVLTVLLLVLLTSSQTLVGDYAVVLDSSQLFPQGFASGLVSRVTLVAFGVAGLPLAVTIAFVVDALKRPAGARVHALAVCVLLLVTVIAFQATNFDLRFASALLQERYLFYVAPLLVVSTACFVSTVRQPMVVAAAGGLLAALIVSQASGLLPIGNPSLFATPARIAWTPFDGWVYKVADPLGVGGIDPTYVFAAAILVATLLVAWLVQSQRRRATLIGLGIAMTVWSGGVTVYAGPRLLAEHEALATVGLAGSIPLEERSWIDRAVGSDAVVGIAPSPLAARDGKPIAEGAVTEPSVWWEAEFWNESVRRSFVYTGLRDWTPYAYSTLELHGGDGRLRTSRPEAPYLVVANTNVRFEPVGRVVARTRDLRLIRPERPYRAAWVTRGMSGLGKLEGRRGASVSVYGDGGARRRARVAITLAGQTGPRGLTVRAAGRSQSVKVFGRRRVVQSVCVPPRGPGAVRFRAPGAPTLRVIGIRVTMGGPC